MNPVVEQTLARIETRSAKTRAAYLDRVARARDSAAGRGGLSCGNLAHACAAAPAADKRIFLAAEAPNIGVVTAYNDMLSAHRPFESFPSLIRETARRCGATAQVAGGVPAMCDGVTQGRAGMELSLFSRDVVAMAAAVALSHDAFSAVIFLGVCDKIAPGMAIAAAAFGHLPVVFAPAGPMPSGLDNAEKARVRERHAAGEVGREALLAAETASYHAPGTCTFYGTANTNQMMLELMGLQLPGASFVNPGTPLRAALTRAAVRRLCGDIRIGDGADSQEPAATAATALSAGAFVNAIVGVLASGGSTNHTIHLPAMARACGVVLEWDDFAALSRVAPLLCRLYPNGRADVNHFQAAGGMAFLVGELRAAGLLVEDVRTVAGRGLAAYEQAPFLDSDGEAHWRSGARESLAADILRPAQNPFSTQGGLKVLRGNLGESIIKVSALPARIKAVEAPARIFHSQGEMMRAFFDGELKNDVVCVIRFQGPRANGMPEMHKLTPLLATLQDAGRQVALVTDGRMSGASGKVPAAIHLTPEAARGGALAKLRDGDIVRLDLAADTLNALAPESEWRAREAAAPDLSANESGCGRELFAPMRRRAASAPRGGGALADLDWE